MSIDIDSIYSKLRKMEVSLEQQTHANHHYYQMVLTKCDIYVSMISKFYTAAKQECSKLQVTCNVVQEQIENKRRHNLVKNEEIQKKYSTGREREFAVDELIKEDISELKSKENRLLLLKDLCSVLNTWLSIMRERKRDAKEQWKLLCETSRAAGLPDPTDKDVKQLNKVIGELEAEAAEAGMNNDIDINDEDIESEDYQNIEEDEQEVLDAVKNNSSKISVDIDENGIFDDKESDDIIIDSGLTGTDNPSESPDIDIDLEDINAGRTDDLTSTKEDETPESEEVESFDDGIDSEEDESEEESSEDDNEPDILNMLSDSGESEEKYSGETGVESVKEPKEKSEFNVKPPKDDSGKDTEEDNTEDSDLEEDILNSLDQIDEDVLHDMEEVQKAKEEAKKAKKAKKSSNKVVIDDSQDQEKTVSGEVDEPEHDKKASSKDSVRKEDAASVSSEVDIDDLLSDLDGF